MNFNAHIHFNEECLLHKVIPSYAELPSTTNLACFLRNPAQGPNPTHKRRNKVPISEKDHLIRELYRIHLQASTEWGTLWDLISSSVHNTTQNLIEKKYTNVSHKIKKNSLNKTLAHLIVHTPSTRAS
jgi:hypothetical protein